MRIRLSLLLAAFTSILPAQTPEQRAVDYLSREVPRWSKENGCFSCHNNGDGARALYVAARHGYKIPAEALADTTRWLLKPADWDSNRANPGFGDKKLARIQFAAALAEFSGDNREALTRAAESLLPYQEPDGSWQVDVGAVGSPVTYGPALATYMARRTLEAAFTARFTGALARATLWLLNNPPRSTLDQSAMLLGLPGAEPAVRQSLALLLRAQSSGGGWGPYPQAPPEPFDTAVALLGLQKAREPDRTAKAIALGRDFLIGAQQSYGGWTETTRPPGSQSYAQHISTTAWAAMALILTDAKR